MSKILGKENGVVHTTFPLFSKNFTHLEFLSLFSGYHNPKLKKIKNGFTYNDYVTEDVT